MKDIVSLLKAAAGAKASDLHLVPGCPPFIRVDGDIRQLVPALADGLEAEALARSLLTPAQLKEVEEKRHLGFSYTVSQLGRFRVEAFYTRGRLGASIRLGFLKVPALEDIGTPPVLEEICRGHSGLVLVCGPTGAGKTTTLAAMVDFINREQACRISTIEDPIEYLHRNKRGVVVQQEVLDDTPSFADALVHVLRQDPDVIVVGEMRSLDTIQTALTAAETGHLVMATLHTTSASQTVDRVIDVFPPYQQTQVRVQLAASLEAIVSQRLLPRIGEGRVLAYEVLVATPAVRTLIRDSKSQQFVSVIQSSGDVGMCTMDACIARLYNDGVIAYDVALENLENRSMIRRPSV
jgi:twitching motility protein PilT